MDVQHEFPNVNPIIPTHYFYLAKRCFKALQENNGKVSKEAPARIRWRRVSVQPLAHAHFDVLW